LISEERAKDAANIKEQHPDKIPVIVERSTTEKTLPILDKTKFLVPGHVTVTELIRVLRRRLQLAPGQAFFLLSNRGLPPGTQTLAELWDSDHDEDGFMYLFYAAQETFG
jgi:microtubule-associated protein 1 light chain